MTDDLRSQRSRNLAAIREQNQLMPAEPVPAPWKGVGTPAEPDPPAEPAEPPARRRPQPDPSQGVKPQSIGPALTVQQVISMNSERILDRSLTPEQAIARATSTRY